jgi:transcriptional regulator with XRE-family HTH domain
MFIKMDGTEVTRLREEQGLSKRALAEAANVTQPTVARGEDSQRMFPQTVRLLGAALGIDPRSLGERSQ